MHNSGLGLGLGVFRLRIDITKSSMPSSSLTLWCDEEWCYNMNIRIAARANSTAAVPVILPGPQIKSPTII